jgi:hypothetical protein
MIVDDQLLMDWKGEFLKVVQIYAGGKAEEIHIIKQ